MFTKLSQAAEQVATGVSRRQFLGRLGRGALALAAAVGGLMVLPGGASGGPRGMCAPNSVFYCLNRSIGDSCGRHARCAVIRGTANQCYCRGNSPGPR